MTGADKTIIITGGNSGLGLEAARVRSRSAGVRLVLACRNQDTAAKAAAETGAEVMALDLGSLASVRSFARAFMARTDLPRLHALICNAGCQFPNPDQRSEDGYELTFAANHLGHYLLQRLLIDQIAPGGRLVIVASGTHDPAQKTGMPVPDLADPQDLLAPAVPADGSVLSTGLRCYTNSKLCNVLQAYELERRKGDRDLMIAAFDPGLMPGTGLARSYPGWARTVWKFILPVLTLTPMRANTPALSGGDLAALATDPALGGTSGLYYERRTPIRSSDTSYDEALARSLWEMSARLTSLTPDGLSAEGQFA